LNVGVAYARNNKNYGYGFIHCSIDFRPPLIAGLVTALTHDGVIDPSGLFGIVAREINNYVRPEWTFAGMIAVPAAAWAFEGYRRIRENMPSNSL
jgi:hypothetical protein